MAITLTKNNPVNLTKKDGSDLNLIRLGLTWFNDTDLDLSLLAVDDNHKAVSDAGYIFYNNKGKLTNQGFELLKDNRTGSSSDDNSDTETLFIDTTRVDETISHLLVLASIYTKSGKPKNISTAKNPYLRIIDEQARLNDPKKAIQEVVDDTYLVYRYNLEKIDAQAVEVGIFSRENNGWSFVATGTPYHSVADFLDQHGLEVD